MSEQSQKSFALIRPRTFKSSQSTQQVTLSPTLRLLLLEEEDSPDYPVY